MERTDAKAWAEGALPGTASSALGQFDGIPNNRYILICRVSRSQQDHNGNLNSQEHFLREAILSCGSAVLDVVHHVGPGWDQSWLWEAAQKAVKTGAILIAATPDRFKRNRYFLSNDKKACKLQATRQDWDDVKRDLDGAQAVTYVHPDASPAVCASLLISWGREFKKMKSGKKLNRKQMRSTWMPLAVQLRQDNRTLREIAKEISQKAKQYISHVSIHVWLKSLTETT